MIPRKKNQKLEIVINTCVSLIKNTGKDDKNFTKV